MHHRLRKTNFNEFNFDHWRLRTKNFLSSGPGGWQFFGRRPWEVPVESSYRAYKEWALEDDARSVALQYRPQLLGQQMWKTEKATLERLDRCLDWKIISIYFHLPTKLRPAVRMFYWLMKYDGNKFTAVMWLGLSSRFFLDSVAAQKCLEGAVQEKDRSAQPFPLGYQHYPQHHWQWEQEERVSNVPRLVFLSNSFLKIDSLCQVWTRQQQPRPFLRWCVPRLVFCQTVSKTL